MDNYVPRPVPRPKSTATRDRLFAIPEGQAVLVPNDAERRKLANSMTPADKREWKFCQRAQPDSTFIVWLEKRPSQGSKP